MKIPFSKLVDRHECVLKRGKRKKSIELNLARLFTRNMPYDLYS